MPNHQIYEGSITRNNEDPVPTVLGSPNKWTPKDGEASIVPRKKRIVRAKAVRGVIKMAMAKAPS